MACNSGPDIIEDGLVLCLDAGNKKSYPGTGTTWTDRSANGYSGTLLNGSTFSSDNRGSIVFDGANDRVNIGASATDLVDNGYAFSICAFVKPNFSNEQRMIFGNANSSRFYIETLQNVFHWGIGGFQNSSTSQASYQANRWYNYCVTYDGNSIARGYLDGVLSDVTQNVTSVVYGGTNLYVGVWQSNLYWKGSIANISVYNRALTADEIRRNYEATVGRYT
jgi:hypothetical protein